VIHEIQPGMLQIFHTPSSLFSFSIRSICFHKFWQGWKMVSAIIDLCQENMANYGESTIAYLGFMVIL
jgi:hypothetical protein